MTTDTDTRLTPRQHLTRGLARTAAGPVEVMRGAVGLAAQSVVAGASSIRRHHRAGKLRRDLADAQNAVRHEFAAAQEAVAALPRTLAELPHSLVEAGRRRRGRRGLAIGAAGGAVLAGGAALFSVVRRSRRPEPSPLPPSVQVEPKP
jgi:hypothetical protein